MPIPDVAIGAILAALIAATVSLLGLIVSKEQKTSEFRQAWIDALRADIARLIGHANALAANRAVPHNSLAEQLAAAQSDLVGINEATANLRLRLNEKEEASQAVLDAIERIEIAFLRETVVQPADLNPMEKELVAKAKIVLKGEWLRVRRGELTFRVAKWSAFGLVLVAATGILWLVAVARPAAAPRPPATTASAMVGEMPVDVT